MHPDAPAEVLWVSQEANYGWKEGKSHFWIWICGSWCQVLAESLSKQMTTTLYSLIQVYCCYADSKLTKPSECDTISASMFYSLAQIDIECWKPPFASPQAQGVWVCVHDNGCATGLHLWVVSRCNHEGSRGATLRWIHHGDWISTPEESNATYLIAGFCWQPRFSVRCLTLRLVLTTQTHNYFKIIIISGEWGKKRDPL